MARLERPFYTAATLVILVALVFFAYYIFLAPAPLEFDEEMVQPEQSQVCPGDTLRWRIGFTLNRAPTIILIVRSWWSIDQQATVLLDDEPQWAAYLEEVSVSEAAREALVPPLPPGNYQLQTGAQSLRAAAAPVVYVVPFSVPEGCNAPPP
jgi:hypothetical protein